MIVNSLVFLKIWSNIYIAKVYFLSWVSCLLAFLNLDLICCFLDILIHWFILEFGDLVCIRVILRWCYLVSMLLDRHYWFWSSRNLRFCYFSRWNFVLVAWVKQTIKTKRQSGNRLDYLRFDNLILIKWWIITWV